MARSTEELNDVVSVKIPGPQNRFILGPALSSSTLSSRVVSSPVKSRWSRHATRNSPTKSQYSQIRNRSYALAVSPQKKPPVTRSRRKSMESKITDNGSSQESGMFSPNESNSLLPGPPKRKVRKGNPPKSPTKSTRRAQRTTCRTTSDTNPTRNKPTVKFLSVSSRKMARWTPIQEQAKALLLESISRSSSYKTVNKATRNLFREQLEKVITKVRNELATAAAPNARRLKSYSNLNSKMGLLKSNILTLTRHNHDMDKRLDSFKSQAEDQLSKVQGMKNLLSSEHRLSKSIEAVNYDSNKDWTSESEDAFCDYLTDLLDNS